MNRRRSGRKTPRLLILGGTAEAAGLAAAMHASVGDGLSIVTSLAGRTRSPKRPKGAVRRGGFGGAQGLEAYLRAESIDLVVDATHPFAAAISSHARVACDRAGVARLLLLRPAWQRQEGDRWFDAADMGHARDLVPSLGRRAFLTVGAGELAHFGGLPDIWFLVRLIEPPSVPPPLAKYDLILARGPFEEAAERTLMKRRRIDVLVTKQSGGSATEAKLAAARALDLPVLMVSRPAPEPGPTAGSVTEAQSWIEDRLAGLDAWRNPG